jgi:hypothetical protein
MRSKAAASPSVRSRLLLCFTSIALVSFAILALPADAPAVIYPANVLDGPANDILDVDGAAMAPDGSGGILYRKQLDGVVHLFAIPLQNGHWGAPTEVDGEDLYGASQPAIAAADGGRLLVVWVQPRNSNSSGIVEDELMSASLQPGASAFGQAIAVDPDVNEPFTGDASAVKPQLAMAPDGSAYVVYRVVVNDCGPLDTEVNPSCIPNSTDKLVQVRVARFEYLTWSSLGEINRAPQIALLDPDSSNIPAIGIDVSGNGIVAWQEPDADGVARIWVRRLFGSVKGNALQASPTSVGGQPVTSSAEDPDVAVSRYGGAQIAFLIKGAASSTIPLTQLYDSSMLSEFDPHGFSLQTARAISGAITSSLGKPSAALDQSGDFRLVWSQGGSVRELVGTSDASGVPVSLGVAASGPVLTTINPAGGGTVAWPGSSGGASLVQAREDYAGGAYQTAQLAGDLGGPVSGLSLGGSGEGDALIAWMEGPVGRSEVVGDFVQAPPAPFVLSTPDGWVRARQASVDWEPTTDAIAGVTYTVYVDGRPVLKGLTGTHVGLSSTLLGNGIHQVQVLATDSAGQRTMSAAAELKIAANPPIVRIALIDHRRGVRVSVSDKASGVEAGATAISFGDGRHANGRVTARHIYARAGLYRITVKVRDKVGNHAIAHLRARVR